MIVLVLWSSKDQMTYLKLLVVWFVAISSLRINFKKIDLIPVGRVGWMICMTWAGSQGHILYLGFIGMYKMGIILPTMCFLKSLIECIVLEACYTFF